MKRKLFVIFLTFTITFLFVACGEKEQTTILLNNGVQVTTIDEYNSDGFAMENYKYKELQSIENFYRDKLSKSAWLFKYNDSQISWSWGNPDAGDGIHDLVLNEGAEAGTYELDLNYDMRVDIVEGVGVADSRDIVRFMLSFVTADPTLLEEKIYIDCFETEEEFIIPLDEGWVNIGDCDVQCNADNGYGLTIVIKKHVESE